MPLDRETAVAEAFRFFRLSDTTLRHEATQFVLNHATAENLPAVLDLLARRKSEQPFTRELSGVRVPPGVSRVTVRASMKPGGAGGDIRAVELAP